MRADELLIEANIALRKKINQKTNRASTRGAVFDLYLAVSGDSAKR
jgi:hypothetical protein